MENKSIDLEATRNRLSTLKYSQLRKAAKRYSVNANQKVIITKIFLKFTDIYSLYDLYDRLASMNIVCHILLYSILIVW